ncbi:MAG TPA: ABC transporter substrate-binding protein [Gaiellaceae bacterium]|nr:ABC transporter substrate-binding protein [Gaiellaceae bacterium]
MSHRLCVLLVGVALLFATAGAGASGSRAASSPQILRIGTTYYVDTLNPFVGIETNDSTAYGMVYPQLVQYGPGLKLVGDWASSWTHTKDGLTWTFHLRSGKWSDGKPLTAQDAVWTVQLALRFRNGATSYLASVLDGVKSASAPNPSTLVLHYARPVAPVLANLEQFFILPQHVWAAHVGPKGSDLKGFHPEQSLPLVAGGAYTVSQFEQKGTTVFKPNPYFYGPKSRAAAVTLTYYTNPTSMTADLERGNLDFVDALPYRSADALKGKKGITITEDVGDEVTNLGFNSNPLKPKNRELLDPKVKEAFEYATPRKQIVEVVFGGHAKPWANIISPWSTASGWVNPAVKPLPYSPAKANAILDSLGYKRGSNGVRVVPATSGRYAQAEHSMTYSVIVPNDLDFNGDRQLQILATAYKQIGVVLKELSGGDGSQAYTMITAPNGKYLTADMYTWYWHPYIDPSFNLSVVTKAQWYDNSDTGYDDPQYDRWWRQQAAQVNVAKRRALVWKMEAYLAQKRPYIQLVDTNQLTAHADGWTGFQPQLWGYCKCFYTSPHPTS